MSESLCDKQNFLSEDDFAMLFTFAEQVDDCDADGYTANKSDVKRMAELGVIQSHGFGRYSVTAFGSWLIETEYLQNPSLPLKTVAEHNAKTSSPDL
jgi:hypothetical protein